MCCERIRKKNLKSRVFNLGLYILVLGNLLTEYESGLLYSTTRLNEGLLITSVGIDWESNMGRSARHKFECGKLVEFNYEPSS